MEKSLEQIQQENRKFILEAIHGCSYEEALKKELGVGCEVIARIRRNHYCFKINNLTCFVANCKYFDGDYLRFRELVGDISVKDLTDEGLERLEEYQDARHRIIEIIGKPLTLSRVLLALPSELYYYKSGNLLYIAKSNQDRKEQTTCDLKKETLEEQTEETQRNINKLFNY